MSGETKTGGAATTTANSKVVGEAVESTTTTTTTTTIGTNVGGGEISLEEHRKEKERKKKLYEKARKNKEALECRMYRKPWPEEGDILLCEVREFAEDKGAYCNLLEYNGLEGLLLFSELQRKRIRSVKGVIKKGGKEVVTVLKLDREKGYIDLSRKRVTDEEKIDMNIKWNKSKIVHAIMKELCTLLQSKYTVKELYQIFGWKLYELFDHAYDGFKLLMNDPDAFYQIIQQEVDRVRREDELENWDEVEEGGELSDEDEDEEFEDEGEEEEEEDEEEDEKEEEEMSGKKTKKNKYSSESKQSGNVKKKTKVSTTLESKLAADNDLDEEQLKRKQEVEAMTRQFQGIPTQFRPVLLEIIEKKLKPTLVTVRTTFELTCFTKHGVKGIREALKRALEWSQKEQHLINEEKKKALPPVKTTTTAQSSSTTTPNANIPEQPQQLFSLKLIAPPEYQLSCETLEAIETMQFMKTFNQVMQTEIQKFGGSVKIKEHPTIVNLDETRMALPSDLSHSQDQDQIDGEGQDLDEDQTQDGESTKAKPTKSKPSKTNPEKKKETKDKEKDKEKPKAKRKTKSGDQEMQMIE